MILVPPDGDDGLARRAESVPGAPGAEGAAEIDARIVAMIPSQLLQPSEIIILLLKPSPWYIVLGSLGALAAIAVFAAIALLLQSRGLIPIARGDLLFSAAGVVAVRLFWQFLDWLSRLYVLTDQRIIRMKGVTRVQVFETPLKNVQHTETIFTLRERLFALGTITFATSGTAGIDASWLMVPQPLEVHRIVVQALRRYGR